MGFEKETYPGGNRDKIREKLESELGNMPEGLKNMISNVYGIFSVAFKKEKGGGFFSEFLKSRDTCREAVTQLDDALVESSFLQVCRQFEDEIESAADQDEKKELEKEYNEYKTSREKKFSRLRQDRKLDEKIGNSWKDLFKNFGK